MTNDKKESKLGRELTLKCSDYAIDTFVPSFEFEDEDEDIKLPQIANEAEKISRKAGIGIDFLAEETEYLIDSIQQYVKALKKAGF